MSLTNDYVTAVLAKQQHQDLLAEADANRLARLARGWRRGWLRRWRAGRGTAPTDRRPAPSASVPVAADEDHAEADRVPVGSGRID